MRIGPVLIAPAGGKGLGVFAAEPLAAGSTLAAIAISMALVAEVGARLAAHGYPLQVFVSPNVTGGSLEHNQKVFAAYEQFVRRLEAERA